MRSSLFRTAAEQNKKSGNLGLSSTLLPEASPAPLHSYSQDLEPKEDPGQTERLSDPGKPWTFEPGTVFKFRA